MDDYPWLDTLGELIARVRSERGDQAADCVAFLATCRGLDDDEQLEAESIRSLFERCGVPWEYS